MSSQILKFLAAAMLIGSLALLFVAYRLSRAPAPPPVATASGQVEPLLHKIVTASHPIRAGQTLSTEDVTLTPVASPPPDALENIADAIGKQPMTAIAPGSPLLRANFPDGNFLAQSLGEDERAIAVKVDELIGVGGFLHPGDRVDVVAYIRADGQHIKDHQSMIILNGVRVLAYAEEVPTKADKSNLIASETPTTKGNKGKSTAVLAIKEEEATRLTLAENAGVLRLSLRPVPDASKPEANHPYTVGLSDISSTTTAPTADKPNGPRVLVIRGSAVETVQLP